jgi:hypothetical protein
MTYEQLADVIILQKLVELYGLEAAEASSRFVKQYDADHAVVTRDMVAGEAAYWDAAADEKVTEELYEAVHATTMDDVAEAYVEDEP